MPQRKFPCVLLVFLYSGAKCYLMRAPGKFSQKSTLWCDHWHVFSLWTYRNLIRKEAKKNKHVLTDLSTKNIEFLTCCCFSLWYDQNGSKALQNYLCPVLVRFFGILYFSWSCTKDNMLWVELHKQLETSVRLRFQP